MPHSKKISDQERKRRQRTATQKHRRKIKKLKGITKKCNTFSKEEQEVVEKIEELGILSQLRMSFNLTLDVVLNAVDDEIKPLLISFLTEDFLKKIIEKTK